MEELMRRLFNIAIIISLSLGATLPAYAQQDNSKPFTIDDIIVMRAYEGDTVI